MRESSMRGLPDSGQPSNSLSSCWHVGNGGTLRTMAKSTVERAAGAAHGVAGV